MTDVLVLLLAIFLGLAVVWTLVMLLGARKPKNATPPQTRKQTDPMSSKNPDQTNDPTSMNIGYMVVYNSVTYIVREVLDFNEGGWEWQEIFLDDGTGNQAWLSAERDPDLELTWWIDVDSPANFESATQMVTYGGQSYRLRESGTANYIAKLGEWMGNSGVVEYHDYRSTSDKSSHLSYERFNDGGWEMSVGIDIDASQLTIYPAPQRSQASES